jgi:EAL domain-containing protein (putative c-di-GMP-specific phosphodiesterase class I)
MAAIMGLALFDRTWVPLQVICPLSLNSRSRMIVNYQPVIELASGKVAKVEVLGRPKAPGKRISDVIRSAEQSGDIKRMTDQILDLALAEWHKVARSDIELSINLSLRNLDEKDLPKRVVKALKRHHLDPNSLWLEIDEKAQQLTNGQWLDRMRELQSVGVRFSVDSFGAEITQATAYDLARLPIAELKIDGPVVSDSDSNMDHRGHITAAVQIARQLKLATSAKGIERAEIAGLCTRLGCTYGQGYFYARPMPVAELVSIIDSFKAPLTSAPTNP